MLGQPGRPQSPLLTTALSPQQQGQLRCSSSSLRGSPAGEAAPLHRATPTFSLWDKCCTPPQLRLPGSGSSSAAAHMWLSGHGQEGAGSCPGPSWSQPCLMASLESRCPSGARHTLGLVLLPPSQPGGSRRPRSCCPPHVAEGRGGQIPAEPETAWKGTCRSGGELEKTAATRRPRALGLAGGAAPGPEVRWGLPRLRTGLAIWPESQSHSWLPSAHREGDVELNRAGSSSDGSPCS